MKIVQVLSTVGVVLLFATPGLAEPKFAPAKRLKLENRKYTPVVFKIDVDGDGDTDLGHFTSYHGAKIGWLENTGKGDFKVREIDVAVTQPGGLGAGDIDGDGDVDFVSYSASKGLLLHENIKKGRAFASKEITKDGLSATTIVLGDFDSDGLMDIAMSGRGGGIEWVQQEEKGVFAGPVRISKYKYSCYRLVKIDLEKDGDPDLLFAVDDKVTALVSDGGAFTEKVVHQGEADQLHAADVNGDGYDDFVVGGGSKMFYYENVEGKAFASTIAAPQKTQNIADIVDTDLADFNGDGKLDILVTRPGGVSIGLYVEDEEWPNKEYLTKPDGVNNQTLMSALDMSGDGVPDLVTMGKLGAGPILYFKNLDKSFKKKKKKRKR